MTDKLVTIATFSDSLQAVLAKAKLNAEDIDCVITEDAVHSLYGHAMGAIKLLVKTSDAEKASKILKQGEQLR